MNGTARKFFLFFVWPKNKSISKHKKLNPECSPKEYFDNRFSQFFKSFSPLGNNKYKEIPDTLIFKTSKNSRKAFKLKK